MDCRLGQTYKVDVEGEKPSRSSSIERRFFLITAQVVARSKPYDVMQFTVEVDVIVVVVVSVVVATIMSNWRNWMDEPNGQQINNQQNSINC